VRFAIWPGLDQGWDDLLQTAMHAEATGWDRVYVADHFMADGEPSLAPRLEGWTAVAGLAAATERVGLGVLVSANTYRHPAVVANAAATIDRISGGRYILGLGAGWQENEHEGYGIELPGPSERLAMLDEACAVVTSLLAEPWTTFAGQYYQLRDAPCEPKPIQDHLPLLIGGGGERVTLRIAAAWADEWNTWGLPEVIAHKRAVLEEHCARLGRDPGEIATSAQVLVFLEDEETQRERLASLDFPMGAMIGGSDELGEVLDAYDEIGLDEFVVSDRTLGADPTMRREAMDRFLEEVARPFRDEDAHDAL